MKAKPSAQILTLLLALLAATLVLAACSRADDDDYDSDDDDSADDDDLQEDDDNNDSIEIGWLVGNLGNAEPDSATVLKTIDGGENWELQSAGISPVIIHSVSAVDDQIAWVVGNADDQGYGVIYRTADGGASWERQGDATQFSGISIEGVSAVDKSHVWVCGVISATRTGVIAHSVDAGRTWELWSDELGVDNTLFKIDAADDQTVWATGDKDSAGYGIVLATSDGGATWRRLGSAQDIPFPLIDLSAVDDSTAWIVGVNDTVARTQDGGASWQKWSVVADLLHVNGVCAISADSAWIAVDYGQVFYIDADSDEWIDASPTPDQVTGVKGHHLIGICTGDGQSIWVSSIYAEGYPPSGLIIHSADGGQNWARQQSPVNDAGFAYFSFVGACK